MRRREFLASAAVAGVVAGTSARSAAQAQQLRLPTVAFLSVPAAPELIQAFYQGLEDVGLVDGRTVTVQLIIAPTVVDMPALAARLAAVKPDVVWAVGTPAAQAMKEATSTVPIVFTGVGDAVRLGLVASLARPGANITGASTTAQDFPAKQLNILRELAPTLRRVAVLNLPANAGVGLSAEAAGNAALAAGIEPVVLDFVDTLDFRTQANRLSAAGVQGVFVPVSTYFGVNLPAVADIAIAARLPVLVSATQYLPFALVGYGVDTLAQIRGTAPLVGTILKGAKPADLPVTQPTTYELGINLRTARAIGIAIPATILAQATQVIE